MERYYYTIISKYHDETNKVQTKFNATLAALFNLSNTRRMIRSFIDLPTVEGQKLLNLTFDSTFLPKYKHILRVVVGGNFLILPLSHNFCLYLKYEDFGLFINGEHEKELVLDVYWRNAGQTINKHKIFLKKDYRKYYQKM